VHAVGQEIGRVLLNLINNAFYAVYERHKEDNEGYTPVVTVKTTRFEHHIEVRVGDNGNGIPAALKEKIFQPFFTTKPAGEGTGLGLSLSYDIIVKGHGGQLAVETEPGLGTTFIITLPLGK
jgi:signal transduction histidine kinase